VTAARRRVPSPIGQPARTAAAGGAADARLPRVVTRWQIVGLSLNDVVGSGVYLLPAAAAAILGPASVWAVPLAGLAVLLIVLCFAEAASHFDRPGSAYLYARTAFGGLVGLEVGWMTWLARVASVASLSVGFAQASSFLWPATSGGAGRAIAITLPVLILTGLNVVGVRSGVWAAVVLLIGKLVPLAIFVVFGLFAASAARVGSQPPGDGSVARAALLLLFAYAGFENTAAAAGEYRDPRRDVPFALLVNIVCVTLLYFAVQWITLGTLPDAAESATPLADASRRFIGSWAGVLIAIGGALSILGTNGNTVFAGPRYLLALARDGFGPAALGRLHPRFRTPANAILLQTAIALPLAWTGTFVALAELSVVARLATYVGTAAAVPVLRRSMPVDGHTQRLPAGALIPLSAVVLGLALAASATGRSLIAAAVALLVGGLLWRFRRDPVSQDDDLAGGASTAPADRL
jgi:amino acid transporter